MTAPIQALEGAKFESFTDKRSGARLISYQGEACRDWWAIDRRPYDPTLDPPLTKETLSGNARRLLPPETGPDGVYCSPWCGFGCKRDAYDRAVREADLICRVLGPGWIPEVWENCGWHFAAQKGRGWVTPNVDGSTIAGTYTITGYTGWCNFGSIQTIVKAEHPRHAIDGAVREMKRRIEDLQAKLAEVEG